LRGHTRALVQDTHQVFKGFSFRYRHSEVAGNGEEADDATRMNAGHDEPVFEPETPNGDGEEAERESADAARTAVEHDAPISKPETPTGDGEEAEEETTDAARTVAEHDEPIPEPETPRQRPAALPPSTPSTRPVSPKSNFLLVNISTGLGLFFDTSLQPEVGKHNRTLAPRNATTPTQAVANPTTELSEGLIRSTGLLSPEGTANRQITYVSSRTSLVHQGPIAVIGTQIQTTLVRAMEETAIVWRISSTLIMKAISANDH
jgi:hypothetical protein